eukprot:scaffold143623_cov30-Tisochrysis_lutea.AAC.1
MVLREAAQALPRPTPVLKHLRRRLDEISWTLGEGCTIAVSFRTDAMHDMPKFMKKCDAVGVTQQGRSAICGGCRQVAQHAIDRYLALPPLEEVENRSVAIFALSRMEVEIEEAHPLAACCVHHTKKAHLTQRHEWHSLRVTAKGCQYGCSSGHDHPGNDELVKGKSRPGHSSKMHRHRRHMRD